MKNLSLLFLLCFISACDEDPNTPGVQITCPTPAPNLAGTWTGTLQNHQLSLAVDEACAVFIGGRSWWVNGEWAWNGRSGTVFGLYATDLVHFSLAMGAQPQPVSIVSLNFNAQVPLVAAVLAGKAGGVWKLPTDTMQVVAAFDSVAVTLTRQ